MLASPAGLEYAPLPAGAAEPVFLGLDSAGAVFAVEVASDPARPLIGLRDALMTASAHDAGLLAYGAMILNWHRRHRFCANCGQPSHATSGGHVRSCPACGTLHYPRTDPVVIMLVIDGERVLLGRGHGWDPGLYSALAGFVEPGETLEHAVAREVMEETQITVADVRYQSSQAWPFPSSLMMGFEATYVSGEATRQDLELDDCRWVTRGELESSKRGEGPIQLPAPYTIARTLIDRYLAG